MEIETAGSETETTMFLKLMKLGDSMLTKRSDHSVRNKRT